jgi:4-hydroxythreonine-4-phosphate dehydrogenase
MSLPASACPTRPLHAYVLPRLAITLGDPAGIGPEVILKALADPSITP